MACVSGTVRWILLPVLSFCVGFLFLPRSSIYSAEGGIKNPLGSKSQFEKGALGETKNKRIREMMTGPSVSPSFSLLTSSIFLVDCLYNARLCALCIFVFEKLFPPQTEITFSFWYCSRIPSSSFSSWKPYSLIQSDSSVEHNCCPRLNLPLFCLTLLLIFRRRAESSFSVPSSSFH